MKKNKVTILACSLALFGLSATPSSALVVLLSDLVPADPAGNIESFFTSNFTNVTEVRHANHANFAGSADARNGTGAFAGQGAADVIVIGRSLSSGDYDAGDAAGYNTLTIPVVSMTSYTVRQDGDRLGWHASGATTNKPIAGDESTVTADGLAILGVPAGSYDFLEGTVNFNGLGAGTDAYGGGSILASVGGDTLAAYWAPGSAPGNPTAATVDTFPGPRLLFNVDNEPNAGNDGANDLKNMTAAGTQALISAIDYATPLNAVPEPSSAVLLALAGLVEAHKLLVHIVVLRLLARQHGQLAHLHRRIVHLQGRLVHLHGLLIHMHGRLVHLVP